MKWKERTAHGKNYPFSSCSFLVDLVLVILFSHLTGLALARERHLFFVLSLLLVVYTSYGLLKTIGSYEKKYGSSGMGDKWLKKR